VLPISAADDLKRVAQRLTGAAEVVALLGGNAAGRAHFVFAQSPGLPFDMAKLLRASLEAAGGRGGGSRDLARGGASGGVDVAACLASASESIGRGS
jgi:alanyl-tRNA synthetase